jgi:hypothetical protein
MLYLRFPGSGISMVDRPHLKFLNHSIAGNNFHACISAMKWKRFSFNITIIVIRYNNDFAEHIFKDRFAIFIVTSPLH